MTGRTIRDDEFILRRIPWEYLRDPRSQDVPQIAAFLPISPNDADGLSVDVANIRPVEETASGRPGKRYHVARLNAGELRRELGLIVVSDPLRDNPAHALIPRLNKTDYKASRKQEMKAIANRIVTDFSELILVALHPPEAL